MALSILSIWYNNEYINIIKCIVIITIKFYKVSKTNTIQSI